jgi:hypothetical protein
VSAAVTQMVAKVLGVMNRVIDEKEVEERARIQREEIEFAEQEKNKGKPKLCYDAPAKVPGKPAGTGTVPLEHKEAKKKKKQPSSFHPGPKVGGSKMGMKPPSSKSESEGEEEKVVESPQAGTSKSMERKQLFEPEDTRSMMRGAPEPEIQPYSPPTPIGPHP